MYVTTFYSFKGGVGRSMALANVAVELARRGRRILVVDFDLEAPGLDTFDVLRPQDEVPGIIDFVHEYLDSNRAPDAGRFLSRSPDVGDRGGELWIMPSGAQQASYAAHFNQIDWADLYDKRDGYLLFEDLKAQWKQVVDPDYVLIDSRTGHTDTGGICTRQLPDAVAILFFPNEQNLRGLTKVVNDIRSEAREPRRKPIELHFIMSNVPDLDDEDEILENKIRAFRNQLAFDRDPLIVHRYDSLSLLNQAVFARDRPKSRLAKEYRELVRTIVGRNLDDRDGALDYLDRTAGAWRLQAHGHESARAAHLVAPDVLERQLRRMEKAHADDGEVLFTLGQFRESHPPVKPDASLFDRAIGSGYDEPEVYLERARLRSRDDPVGAGADALSALQGDDVPRPLIWEALSLVRSDRSEDAAASPSVMALGVDERVSLATGLQGSPDEIAVSMSILKQVAGDPAASEADRGHARERLARRLIASGACREAVKLLRRADRSIASMKFEEAFDYGMAAWCASGAIMPDPFARAVELHDEIYGSDPALESEQAPEFLMCMAVACSATGDTTAATRFAARARKTVDDYDFSCWRYCEVPANEFKEDLHEIQAWIDGDTTRVPRFMRSRSTARTCA